MKFTNTNNISSQNRSLSENKFRHLVSTPWRKLTTLNLLLAVCLALTVHLDKLILSISLCCLPTYHCHIFSSLFSLSFSLKDGLHYCLKFLCMTKIVDFPCSLTLLLFSIQADLIFHCFFYFHKVHHTLL